MSDPNLNYLWGFEKLLVLQLFSRNQKEKRELVYRRVVEGRRMVGSNEEARQQFEELIKVAESLGPVVQSIVSLTSSLRGQVVNCFTTL